ncbi:hypothetical protein BJ170DRAFT_689600 [Xylariales sp. AK1849]|nr:hypothetical protein BJ170DRAFT_689600 [Xylariales sp. AK1849]
MSLTAPVVKENFAFANGDLFAEASGQNRHRRATPAELKDHFKSGNDKDRPAHWFEAQLIHYGLQPSKTKAVARMRLFDAVNAGKLSVPAHITKLESELKKEWAKKDRDAKKAPKGTATNTTTEKKGGMKRKAEENVDIVVNVGGINVTVSASNSSSQAAAKKAKTTTTKTATTAKAVKDSPTPKATPKPKAPAALKWKTPASSTAKAKPAAPTPQPPPKEKPASKATTSSQPSSVVSPAKALRTKQTARRGGISQGLSRDAAAISSPAARPPRTKQTARCTGRGGASMARGRVSAPAQSYTAVDHDQDEPPPPYSEYQDDDVSSIDDGHDDDDDDGQPLAPLGLLNGRYEIESSDVTGNWPHYGSDFGLVLTLAGSSLWGSFDLGVYEGVLCFDVRPYQSSHERLWFKWRGREDQGPMVYGDHNRGWIKFLGNGRVEGWLDIQDLEFHGRRAPGQGTRSEIDARSLQSEWDGYNEYEYERENRARW